MEDSGREKHKERDKFDSLEAFRKIKTKLKGGENWRGDGKGAGEIGPKSEWKGLCREKNEVKGEVVPREQNPG